MRGRAAHAYLLVSVRIGGRQGAHKWSSRRRQNPSFHSSINNLAR